MAHYSFVVEQYSPRFFCARQKTRRVLESFFGGSGFAPDGVTTPKARHWVNLSAIGRAGPVVHGGRRAGRPLTVLLSYDRTVGGFPVHLARGTERTCRCRPGINLGHLSCEVRRFMRFGLQTPSFQSNARVILIGGTSDCPRNPSSELYVAAPRSASGRVDFSSRSVELSASAADVRTVTATMSEGYRQWLATYKDATVCWINPRDCATEQGGRAKPCVATVGILSWIGTPSLTSVSSARCSVSSSRARASHLSGWPPLLTSQQAFSERCSVRRGLAFAVSSLHLELMAVLSFRDKARFLERHDMGEVLRNKSGWWVSDGSVGKRLSYPASRVLRVFRSSSVTNPSLRACVLSMVVIFAGPLPAEWTLSPVTVDCRKNTECTFRVPGRNLFLMDFSETRVAVLSACGVSLFGAALRRERHVPDVVFWRLSCLCFFVSKTTGVLTSGQKARGCP